MKHVTRSCELQCYGEATVGKAVDAARSVALIEVELIR